MFWTFFFKLIRVLLQVYFPLSDWLRKQREFSTPITERGKKNKTIPEYLPHST